MNISVPGSNPDFTTSSTSSETFSRKLLHPGSHLMTETSWQYIGIAVAQGSVARVRMGEDLFRENWIFAKLLGREQVLGS